MSSTRPSHLIVLLVTICVILYLAYISDYPHNPHHSRLPSTATLTTTHPSTEWTFSTCSSHSRRKQRPGLAMGVPVQYVHVPKAGGTTIQESLLDWAAQKGFATHLHDGDHDTKWNCPAVGVDEGVFMGHRGFGFCEKLDKKYGKSTGFFVVALREPVSRFRSLFDYLMENDYPQFEEYHQLWNGAELSQLVIEADKAFNDAGSDAQRDALVGPNRLRDLATQQTRFMCGWDCVGLKRGVVVSMDEKLRRALDNLDRTDVVVVMEHLDDMIDQLKYHTTLIPNGVEKFPMENKHTGKKSVLTEEAAEIVAAWSTHDVVLYEKAQNRHQELTARAKSCSKLMDNYS